MSLPLIIEALVAVLLLCTILYCVRLNKSIKQLKGHERMMKTTIAELLTATGTAERAIAGLKTTVREADQTLGERLRAAEKFSTELARQITGGDAILKRITQIAALQPGAVPAPVREVRPVAPDTERIKAQAQAFAERARSRRVQGRAA